MKQLLILFFSILWLSTATAQPLQKHQGKLSNGFTDAGNITYTYRTDAKTGEQIKNGTFRYSVKAKDDQFRFSHNISGNYTSNLKDGNWSYKINQKDFKLQHSPLYTSGTVSLEAQYKNGHPDGNWLFESILKTRAGKEQDKWYWQKYDSAETITATIPFKEGLITGSFHIKNDRQFEVSGVFDEQGFYQGEWVWKTADSTITWWWDHGLEVKMMVTDQEGNILHMEDYSKNIPLIRDYQELCRNGNRTKAKEYSFSLDTLSTLKQRSDPLYQFIQETVYYPHYVLSKEIDGDKMVYYDHQRYQMRFTLKGMYTISIKNHISTTQVQYYSRIGTLIDRMESHLNHMYQLRRDGKLSKGSGDVIKLMEFNMNLARRYACIGETIKLYMQVNEGIGASEGSCAYLKSSIDKMPTFKTREEALKYLVEKVTMAEKQNEIHYNTLVRTPRP